MGRRLLGLEFEGRRTGHGWMGESNKKHDMGRSLVLLFLFLFIFLSTSAFVFVLNQVHFSAVADRHLYHSSPSSTSLVSRPLSTS